MTSIPLSNSFSKSYSQFENYPCNLILSETYGASKLGSTRDRLQNRSRHLFVEDNNTVVAVKDVLLDGRTESHSLTSDLKVQEWLGAKYQVGSNETLIATTIDPRCRFVFLLPKTIFSPLSISAKSASRLLTYHQMSPTFFEFLDVYGSIRWIDRELRFSGFKTEIYLENPEPSSVLPELGRTGRRYQMCYNIKTVALRELVKDPGPGQSLWQIRQAAIHHQFDLGSGVQLWIYGDPHGALKKRTTEVVPEQQNSKERFDTMSASFNSSLKIHLQSAKWSAEGWRQYILYLEEALGNFTSLLILTSGGRGSRLEQEQLHYVQQYEDWINNCIMTLESNADNLTSLSTFYTSIVRHDDFPIAERRACEKQVKHFINQLNELVYDAKMQTRRTRVLQKMMAHRKATCVQMLQAQAARQAVELSATMFRQAEETSQETVAMRIITIITLLYLPPTFVSTLFSTDIVKYQGGDGSLDHDIFSPLALQRFLEFSLPLMLLTFTVAFGWLWYERILAKRKAAKLAEDHPDMFGQAKAGIASHMDWHVPP